MCWVGCWGGWAALGVDLRVPGALAPGPVAADPRLLLPVDAPRPALPCPLRGAASGDPKMRSSKFLQFVSKMSRGEIILEDNQVGMGGWTGGRAGGWVGGWGMHACRGMHARVRGWVHECGPIVVPMNVGPL